jgi:arsenite methyltransferase
MARKDTKISKEYTKAINTKTNSIVSNTGQARFAEYSQQELSGLPDNITEHSFGCGNPLSFSNVQPGQTVLDIGCGAGLDLMLAVDKVGDSGQVIGVDFNPDMLALASKRVCHHHNIELRIGRIENLPFDSNSIDWVISNCVINLSNDKPKTFGEIARVLKSGGEMVISDIVAEKLPYWVRRSGVLRAACAGGVISEQRYLEGLSAAGLVESKIVGRQYYDASQLASVVSDSAPPLISKLRCCGKKLLHEILTLLAKPIAENIWSVKIYARKF